MKTIFLTFLFCILFCFSAFSQEAEQIDSFGDGITCEDYLARMDAVINQAHNNLSSNIFVLIYEGKQLKYNRKNKTELIFPHYGLANAKIRSVKEYLSLRNAPAERFVFVKAGFREEFMVEIWLVPAGAIPPKSTPTLTKMRYRKGKAVGFCIGCCEG